MAQQWKEIGNKNSNETTFGTDFMMHPDILYNISFAGEQCQFIENSILSIVYLEIKMGTANKYNKYMNKYSGVNPCVNHKEILETIFLLIFFSLYILNHFYCHK